MRRVATYLAVGALLLGAQTIHAQFLGGAGDGAERAVLLSAIPCTAYFNAQADGAALATQPNPDPCNHYDGGLSDGHASAMRPNPDSCGHFEGGLADGHGSALRPNPDPCNHFDGGSSDGNAMAQRISPVPCTSFFASLRDGSASAILVCAPLAVTASELYGRSEGQDGLLWWYTFSEINNLGFILLRSNNQSDWTEIAFLPGLSLSSVRRNYEYLDTLMQAGVNHYRWEQVDFDGHRTLSNIVTLVRTESNSATLVVYPNPVGTGQLLNVYFSAPEPEAGTYSVFDAFGRLVYAKDFPAQDLPMEMQIGTEGLAQGLYFLVLETQSHRLGKRFLVD